MWQVLYLQENHFGGGLPPDFGASLPSLRYLEFQRNSMEGWLPTQLGGMTNLQVGWRATALRTGGAGQTRHACACPTRQPCLAWQVLDGGENSLYGGLPTELGLLTELRTLRLPANSLSGPIPTQLGLLQRLEVLDLYANQLEGDMPSELAALRNLRLLYLQNEHLLPMRLRYCEKRFPNLGKYSYRIVREEYGRMIHSICPSPLSTLGAFGTLAQLSGEI